MRPIQVRLADTEKEKAAKRGPVPGMFPGAFPGGGMMNPMAAMQLLQMQAMQQQQQPYGQYGVRDNIHTLPLVYAGPSTVSSTCASSPPSSFSTSSNKAMARPRTGSPRAWDMAQVRTCTQHSRAYSSLMVSSFGDWVRAGSHVAQLV